MADYPDKKLAEGKGNDGLKGPVIDSGIEGQGPEVKTIRSGTKGKKGAGHVGENNVNHK